MLKLTDLIIRPSETLRSALNRMTQNHKGVLFVCDDDAHLIGVISDGDVRRSLLDDTLLVAPVSKAMNTDPITARTAEEAIELLRRLKNTALPVVDPGGRMKEIVVDSGGEISVLTDADIDPELARSPVQEPGAVAIIPARGGSKRVPRKNLAQVAGQSLLSRAIEAAKAAQQVSHVIVSTDDPDVADAARALGISVPWLRPAELARDDSRTVDVILHAADWALRHLRPIPELGVLLEPTAPLRTPEQIDEAIDALRASDADSAVSVCELPHVFNPEEVLVVDGGLLRPYVRSRTMNSRRLHGQQAAAYVPTGLVYAFRISAVLEHRSIFGRKAIPIMTGWENYLDVDTAEDLELADFKLRRRPNAF
jgi:CMP-N,N'-diacetyllegionaminic acid synthase